MGYGSPGHLGSNQQWALYPGREDAGHLGEMSAAPVGYVIPRTYGGSYDAKSNYEESKRIRAGRKEALRRPITMDVGGSMDLEVLYDFIGWPLKYLFGNPVSTPAAAPLFDSHVFTPEDSIPYCHIECNHIDVANTVDLYPGHQVADITIKIKPAGITLFTVNWVSVGLPLTYTPAAAPADGTLTDDASLSVVDGELTIAELDGAAFEFEEITLKMENVGLAKKMTLAGGGVASRLQGSTFRVSGSAIVPFTSDAFRAAARAQTSRALVVKWGPRALVGSLNIAVPHLTFNHDGDGAPADPGSIMHNYSFQAFDNADADEICTVTLENNTASYAGPVA